MNAFFHTPTPEQYAVIQACETGNLTELQHLIVLGGVHLIYAPTPGWDAEPIGVASEHGHLDMVKYLVGLGADVHVNDDEPIRVASEHGHVEVVEYLVELGADIHVRDDEPLRWASEKGHLPVVKYLVSVGADIHAYDHTNRCACEGGPVCGAVVGASFGHLEVLKYLVSVGADIHVENDEPLRMASARGHLDVVAYLVELGATLPT
jgi:ankyrin repeat protein